MYDASDRTEFPSTPSQTMLRAIDDNRRLQKFIETMRINDESNKLYAQVTDMCNEMWDAFLFVQSLPV